MNFIELIQNLKQYLRIKNLSIPHLLSVESIVYEGVLASKQV